uniref:ORC1/DEAH AAA+ ATPase domain-containing protein n=1 Tax=Candidatus Kentrum sp. LFY TaxID=2126342 RepID=A0A450UEA6_9GAMM|nr:MAG: hypothetical protein BECKLFY1418A_GA0070994_101348 [Candidatus Kentron sp. LFY]
MQEKTWPGHYSPRDIEILESIPQWLAENGYSQAALARLSRIGESTMSQIMNGTYTSPPGNLLVQVEFAMSNKDKADGLVVPTVSTSVLRLAETACDMARANRNFSVLSGYVGTGKTFGIRHYAATYPNTYLFEANPTMTAQSLIRLFARRIAKYEHGSAADKFDAVVSCLKGTNGLIIMDEAETLTGKQLHTIRRLRDIAGVGVVLSGTEHLSGIIRPEHGVLDQIRSRVGFWPETVYRISGPDCAALTQAAFGAEEVREDVVERLYAYCKGSARMLVEGLIAAVKKFRKERDLDVLLVDSVAKKALNLQSIA